MYWKVLRITTSHVQAKCCRFTEFIVWPHQSSSLDVCLDLQKMFLIPKSLVERTCFYNISTPAAIPLSLSHFTTPFFLLPKLPHALCLNWTAIMNQTHIACKCHSTDEWEKQQWLCRQGTGVQHEECNGHTKACSSHCHGWLLSMTCTKVHCLLTSCALFVFLFKALTPETCWHLEVVLA